MLLEILIIFLCRICKVDHRLLFYFFNQYTKLMIASELSNKLYENCLLLIKLTN